MGGLSEYFQDFGTFLIFIIFRLAEYDERSLEKEPRRLGYSVLHFLNSWMVALNMAFCFRVWNNLFWELFRDYYHST